MHILHIFYASPFIAILACYPASIYRDAAECRRVRKRVLMSQQKLELHYPNDFGTFGRYTEVPVAKMTKSMKEAYDFTMQLRGLVPGPHRIWLTNPILSRTIVPTGLYYQKESTLTKAEIEIVTSITTSRWLSGYASYEHERIGTLLGHLPAETVERMIAGHIVSFADDRQQVVYELASALVKPRLVSAGLFRRVKEQIGDAGIVDVSVLIGWFTIVSMTLNAYDVPANAQGLDQ
jgi:4-carboxymuconolactone decarboxylase